MSTQPQPPIHDGWQPPPNYEQVESALPGITIFAPIPETRLVDAVKNFKCPKCGASTRFDVAAGGVACEYCGYAAEVDAQEVGRKAAEYEFTLTNLLHAQQGWGVVRRELHCENCGADLAIPEGSVTSTCPFCASNKVNVRTATDDELRPRFLVPFTVDEQHARTHVREWLGQGWLYPKELQSLAMIHRIPGIYLPFWTFDAHVISDWKAEVGRLKSKTRYDSQSKSWKTHTRVEWRWQNGQATTIIDDMLVNGSSHINQTILNRLFPFDLNQLVAYSPDYLAGWQSHAYDVSLIDAWEYGKKAIRQRARNDCHAQISSSRVRNFQMTADFTNESWRYILLPIYLSAYVYEGKTYQLMVNGQTGMVAGQKPVAWWKIWTLVGSLAVPGLVFDGIGLGYLLFTGNSPEGYLLAIMWLGGILVVLSVFLLILLYKKAVTSETEVA